METNYILQSLYATLFTWTLTSIGASIVFLFKKVNKNIMDYMLAIAAGIMIAASFFSLLLPSIEMANKLNLCGWLISSVSILIGTIILFLGDKIFHKIKLDNKNNKLKRSIMLIFSITLHNIPEGLAIGVAFGSIIHNLDGATLSAAWMLAIGIGIQNMPEGMAISLPLRREGISRNKSFLFGVLSGIVEPISAVIGAILIIKVRILLPFMLALAAGAMLYVVIEELIPESQTNNNKSLISLITILGFIFMMILDLSLG